ncbi:MAG: ATP-binding protein, partial [Nitrospiraceae bacterium]|nr:ATP-binding protein [Nitrospiraceae bacterium]
RSADWPEQAGGEEKGAAKCALLKPTGGKTPRLIEYKRAPIREKNGRITGKVLVFSDITEKRKSEEERLKWQRLESIGVLAGGIAHDFNNILTAIIGNISIAKLLAAEDKVRERLEKAERASNRARDLTRQLLTFSKGGGPVKKTVSIGELIRENADFAVSGTGVKCEYFMPGGIWHAEIDEGQISQVIQNLIINANQAMPMGGTITVRARNLVVQSAGPLPIKPGRYVQVSVSDTGPGIPEQTLPRIFDPYFTTKQYGSGLGLATAYSIMRRHGGYINAESRPGSGAVFHLYLPASKKSPEIKAGTDPAPSEKRRVLVLDDDEMVRDVVAKMLASLGYEVELSEDGSHTIDTYRRALLDGKPFDAVIMDLTIPGGMGGKECVERLIRINPDVVAIVSSGYSDDPILSNYRDFFFRGVVSKPYRIEELSRILRQAIG